MLERRIEIFKKQLSGFYMLQSSRSALRSPPGSNPANFFSSTLRVARDFFLEVYLLCKLMRLLILV
jgi:hypothetical protein